MNRKYILIIAATGMTSFLSTYLTASLNLALKIIGHEYSVNASDLSLLTSLFLLFSSIFIVPFGKLSDSYGPKKTLLIGCIFFIVSNLLLIFFAHNFTSLLFFRSLQGISTAFLLVSNTPILTLAIPKAHRATAIGFSSGLIYFGTSSGNFIGGVLTEYFGWRSIFISAAIAASIAFIIIKKYVPDHQPENSVSQRLDIPGVVFYALTLILLQAGAANLHVLTGKLLLTACLLSLILFINRQLRIDNPMYDVRLFMRNKVFAASNIAVLFSFIATYGSQYLLTLYLQCNRGLTAMEAGKIMLIQPLMQLFFSPLAGIISDKTSPSVVSSVGIGFIGIALFMLANLTGTTPYEYIYLSVFLSGIGISLFSAPNTTIILSSVADNKKGMAAASNSIMRNIGMQTSMIVCGTAFLMVIGQVKGIPPESYDDMLVATKICYSIFTVICLIGMGISLIRKKSSGMETTFVHEVETV